MSFGYGGGSYAAAKFAADAKRIALCRGLAHGELDLAASASGYAIPSGAPDLKWWGNPTLSPDTTVDGAAVTSYVDHHAAYDTLAAAGAVRPTYAAAGIDGKPALSFDGTQKLEGTAQPAFGRCMIAVAQVHSAPTDSATPYDNANIWGDHDNGYQAFGVRSSGKVQAYWYDATGGPGTWGDQNWCVEAAISFDVPLIIVAHLRGDLGAGTGSMELQVNNGTKVVGPAVVHTRNSIQIPMQFGHGTGGGLVMKLAETFSLFDNTAEQPYEVAVVSYMRNWLHRKYPGAW